MCVCREEGGFAVLGLRVCVCREEGELCCVRVVSVCVCVGGRGIMLC